MVSTKKIENKLRACTLSSCNPHSSTLEVGLASQFQAKIIHNTTALSPPTAFCTPYLPSPLFSQLWGRKGLLEESHQHSQRYHCVLTQHTHAHMYAYKLINRYLTIGFFSKGFYFLIQRSYFII